MNNKRLPTMFTLEDVIKRNLDFIEDVHIYLGRGCMKRITRLDLPTHKEELENINYTKIASFTIKKGLMIVSLEELKGGY